MNRIVLTILGCLLLWQHDCMAKSEISKVMSAEPDLRNFSRKFDPNYVGVAFTHVGGAVFAPVDTAFANRQKSDSDLYLSSQHATKEVVNLRDAPKLYETYFLTSLYLSVKPRANNPSVNDYFINNAKIIAGPITVPINSNNEVVHQLYKVDQVIEPIVYHGATPTAFGLVAKPDILVTERKVGFAGLSKFMDKIVATKQRSLFDEDGHNTYFIPVHATDRALKSSEFDADLINAHVVKNATLFLRTFPDSGVKTGPNNMTILSVDEFGESAFVRCFTVGDKSKHHKGVTSSEILLPNIKVKNGVVHFIRRPLVHVDSRVDELLDESSKGPLSKFMQLVAKSKVWNRIRSASKKTIFAFSNEAYERVKPKFDALNETALEDVLRLHVVESDVISLEDVSTKRIVDVSSIASGKNGQLSLSVEKDGAESVLYVDAGSVKARAVVTDIRGIDGSVHVIDKVLGLAYQTIAQKLENDPTLWNTFYIAANGKDNWANVLNKVDNGTKYTFFAPSENAWKSVERNYGTSYKQLKNHIYMRNTFNILNRHLVKGEVITFEDLLKKTEVQTENGALKVKKEGGDVILEWDNVRAKIERSNIHAINGVIHAIDSLLFRDGDMKVSPNDVYYGNSGSGLAMYTPLCLLSAVCVLLLRRYLA